MTTCSDTTSTGYPVLENAIVHIAPRMEWAKRVNPIPMDASSDDGWKVFASTLLKIQRIDPAAKRDRRTKSGTLRAKECSPGLLPYLLPTGKPRGGVAAEARWVMVPFDLDAVGLPVDEVLTIVERAFAGLRRLVWTTWSCRDGKASVRVMLILDRTATLHEVALAWWWGRRALLDAGLPEVNVKDGGPTVDPCALDGRLFYLLAVPTPMVPGTEDWGGTKPKGDVGEAGDIPLDIAAVQQAGLRARDVDEPAHFARWPRATVPENRHAAVRHGLKIITSSKRAGGYGGRIERVDFTATTVDDTGLNLLEWALRELEPGHEVAIGFPFEARATGDGILQGSSCNLHRSDDGRVWLYSFKNVASYFHEAAGGVVEEALPGVEMISSSTPGPQNPAEKSAELVDTILGPADPAAVPDPGWEPTSEQERIGRGHTRMGMTAYWGTLADRIEERRAKAAALDPALVAASKRTMELAKEWTPIFRAAWAAAGIHPPTKPCGFVQGVGDVYTHSMGALGRGCAKRLCGRCGYRLAAIEAAAAATMPTVDDQGRVDGAAMEDRILYRYEERTRDLPVWLRRYRRVLPSANDRLGSDTQTLDPERSFADGEPAYVTLTRGAMTRVLATARLAPSRKGGGGAPDAEGAGRDEIREAILGLALEALTPRWTRGVPDMTTGEIMPETVMPYIGRGLTSSQNLHLNPDAISRDAVVHAVVVEAEYIRGVKEFIAATTSRGVTSRTDASGEYGSATTSPVEDPVLRAEIWSAVQVRPPAPPLEDAVDVDGGYEPNGGQAASPEPELEPWRPRDRARVGTSAATFESMLTALLTP